MSRLISLFALFLGFLFVSCELYQQDEYQEYYVVESYLVANRALPGVRLTRTLPFEQTYKIEEAAISDAEIRIHLLDENNTIERTYTYQNVPTNTQSFYRTVSQDEVIPGRTYRLEINFPDNNNRITATTRVPGAFQITGSLADTVFYQSQEQITTTTTLTDNPNRQTYFVFSVIAGNPVEENLTPFYRDLVVEQDEDLEDFRINSSGIINEENYDVDENGRITLRVPWLAIAFYENNVIVANTIDDNLYDFIRSQEVQTGGGPSTLPPGEIQNIIYNVEGGIGIFGSLASDSNRVYIKRNNQLP